MSSNVDAIWHPMLTLSIIKDNRRKDSETSKNEREKVEKEITKDGSLEWNLLDYEFLKNFYQKKSPPPHFGLSSNVDTLQQSFPNQSWSE